MIKINLLAAERKVAKKAFSIHSGQKLTIGCSLILVLAGSAIGWRYWVVNRDSNQIDVDISAAQQETSRLHSIISQVQQFEQRKAQLQQRVALIEELRSNQTGPVHMLDQISRSLPPMLWLTEVKQTAVANEVLIDGRCTTLTGLSDFVANLEASGYFKKSVEIVSSNVESVQSSQTGELIRFQVKALFQQPVEAKTARAAAPVQKGN